MAVPRRLLTDVVAAWGALKDTVAVAKVAVRLEETTPVKVDEALIRGQYVEAARNRMTAALDKLAAWAKRKGRKRRHRHVAACCGQGPSL